MEGLINCAYVAPVSNGRPLPWAEVVEQAKRQATAAGYLLENPEYAWAGPDANGNLLMCFTLKERGK